MCFEITLDSVQELLQVNFTINIKLYNQQCVMTTFTVKILVTASKKYERLLTILSYILCYVG